MKDFTFKVICSIISKLMIEKIDCGGLNPFINLGMWWDPLKGEQFGNVVGSFNKFNKFNPLINI